MARIGRAFPAKPILSKAVVPVTAVSINVPLGSLVLSGLAPTILTPRTVAVPLGGLVLTGLAPTVTTAVAVPVPLGGLVLTGLAPVVATPRAVAVPLGTLTLSTLAPVVSVSGSQAVQVPKGNLSLTGLAPAVVATGQIVTAYPGPAGAPGPAGRKRPKFALEIDGKLYPVASRQEAVAVLRKAKETVKREVRQEVRQVQRLPAKVPDLPELPAVSVHGDDELVKAFRPQIERFERDLNSIFVQANLRVQEVLAEQDDEDILMLL